MWLQLDYLRLFHTGLKYTWRSNESRKINSRLGRVLINADMISKIPNHKVEVLPSTTSDHFPLHITFNKNNQRSKGTPFRYANSWHLCDDYIDAVDLQSIVCTDGTCWYSLVCFLKIAKNKLKKWNKMRPKQSDTTQTL